MIATEILARAQAAGVRLWLDGGKLAARPKAAITDELRLMIRAHKASLVDALAREGPRPVADVAHVAHLPEASECPTAHAVETRRQRVLAMLAERPGIRYAFITDTEACSEAVVLALAIRGAMPDGGIVTCELLIPREKYDPFLLLDLIARYGATIH